MPTVWSLGTLSTQILCQGGLAEESWQGKEGVGG